MNNLIKSGDFTHQLFGTLTTIKNDNGDVFFVSNEVSSMLDYVANKNLLERLDNDEKLSLNYEESKAVLNRLDIHSSGVQLLTESGLYNSVLGSKKESAKLFKKWITSEVLPSIRKHGMYATDNIIEQILNNPDLGIELLTKLKEERAAKLEAEKTVAILTHVNKTYTASEIAQELGFKSAMAFNKVLSEKKIQYKQNETWILYTRYSHLGYVDIKQEVLDTGKIVYHRRWTQLGREFLVKLFNISN